MNVAISTINHFISMLQLKKIIVFLVPKSFKNQYLYAARNIKR